MSTVIFSSCKKDDYTDPKNLSGTEWKSTDVAYVEEEYYLLKFTSQTNVEFWGKNDNEPIVENWWKSIYFIEGNKLSIDYPWGHDDPYTGSIDGKTINLIYDGELTIFTKQ